MLASLALAAGCGGGASGPLEHAQDALAGTYCSEPVFSVSPVSGDPTRALLVAQSTCGTAPAEYRFMVTPPGARPVVLREYAPDGTFDFTAAGPQGRYGLTVQVRPSGSTAQYDALAYGSFYLGDVCSTGSLQTSVTGGATGSTVDLTALAACRGTAIPEYRFLVKDPGATAYREIRPYGADRTFRYSTQPSGRYEFLAQARAVGNLSDFELWATRSTLAGATCSSATVTASYDGSRFDLAAAATCLESVPEYRFLMRKPGTTTFQEIRPWGANPSHSFDLMNATPGRWEVQVYARAAGNASDWEAIAKTSVAVGTTCYAAGLTATYDGNGGVDLSGDAACAYGAPAEYRFLVRRPGSWTFVEARPYGPDPAFHFRVDPPSAGRFEFQVQARVQGNLSDYEALANAPVLVGSTCTSATLAAMSDDATRVDLVATASCDEPDPEYRFLAKRPGATEFLEVRPYSPDPKAAFAIDAATFGRWELIVQVRRAGNASDYESSAWLSKLVGSTCISAGLAATYAGGDRIDLAATAACVADRVPEFRFLVKRPGEATFSEVRRYEPGPTFQLYLPYPVPGRYELQVLVRAAGNASDWEAQATATTFVGSSCSSAALNARYDGGGLVDLSATSMCTPGTGAEFRFLVRRPGSTAFAELRGWGPDPHVTYPTPGPAGRYEFQVNVRAAGHASDEATAKASVLVGNGCSGATLAGNSDGWGRVDLSASATCTGGIAAEYRFLVRRPGATSFTQLRGYSTDPRFQFWANPPASGRYEFQVQARAQGNASDYEATASFTTSLGNACSAATLDGRYDGSAAVDLRASATCSNGAAPEYRFLVKRPGETAFSEARGWGPDAGFWFLSYPPAAGRYEFQVNVRAAGNASEYEATARWTTFMGSSCSSASLAARSDGFGTVWLSAMASCSVGAFPEYRFMVRLPGATSFTDVRPYGPGSQELFYPSYLPPGRYEFQVYVRAAGNASEYEAVAKSTVTIGSVCTSATLTATPHPGSDLVELAATAACGAQYAPVEYRFLVKPPGAPAFVEVRPYGPIGELPYFVTPNAPGRYEFQVQVRVAGNGSDYEATATATTFVGTACTFTSLSATFDGRSTVQLVPSASCRFGFPEYRVLVREPGASGFTELSPYAPTPWFAYVPPYPQRGRYEFQAYVRAFGNTADESSATTSVLIGETCGGAALVASPTSATTADLVAAAACARGMPEYRFLARPPGASTFVEIRPYGPEPFALVGGPDPGRWELQVQVRSEGNASDWEAQATASALVGYTCRAASLTSTQYGSSLNLHVEGVCDGAAEYRLLYRAVGAPAFTELRPYAGTADFTWDASALPPGKYEVQVQARREGNLSPYEATATVVVSRDPT